MIYWYTGQPGHGKTLHAIDRAIEFKEKGRIVYVCNVRDFDYDKTGMFKMTPEQFRDWTNFLPDGAVALVDEAYEHEMLPKRPPGAKVPHHVEQLAKHRHRGIDFIFICQSPDKQCDVFTHDLIERHIHVRRRFGTKFVHLREFDRYEKNPEKGYPLVVKRKALPKRVFGTYKSTELDTTERRIPWYYIALAVLLPATIIFWIWTFKGMGSRLGGSHEPTQPAPQAHHGAASANGALATVAASGATRVLTLEDHIERFTPRVPSQPWTAPAYDDVLRLPSTPPRLFCMISGDRSTGRCACYTEQATAYRIDIHECRTIAIKGQYEPFRVDLFDQPRLETGVAMMNHHMHQVQAFRARPNPDMVYGAAGTVGVPDVAPEFGTITRPAP